VQSGSAKAGAAVATIIMAIIRAAVINKLMRLITLYPFLTTSPQRFMSQAVSGRMCEFAGAGRIVSASTKIQTSVRPFARKYFSLATQATVSFALRSLSQKQNRPQDQ
jgi:hypothetical protein